MVRDRVVVPSQYQPTSVSATTLSTAATASGGVATIENTTTGRRARRRRTARRDGDRRPAASTAALHIQSRTRAARHVPASRRGRIDGTIVDFLCHSNFVSSTLGVQRYRSQWRLEQLPRSAWRRSWDWRSDGRYLSCAELCSVMADAADCGAVPPAEQEGRPGRGQGQARHEMSWR